MENNQRYFECKECGYITLSRQRGNCPDCGFDHWWTFTDENPILEDTQ